MNANLEMEMLQVSVNEPKIITKIHTDLGSGTLEVVSVTAGHAVFPWLRTGAPAVVWVIKPVSGDVWKKISSTAHCGKPILAAIES